MTIPRRVPFCPSPVNRLLVLTALLCAIGCPAQAQASGNEIPAASISSDRSCFEGDFATLASYLKFIRNGRPAITSQVISEAEARYQYWTTQFDCRLITYEVDGTKVHGFYSKPKTREGQKLPVIIYNHGGNADTGWVRPQFIFGKMFPVAIRGFVVVGSQYRGTAPPGEPNPSRLLDEFGGNDVRDVLALVSIADKLPFVDSTRVGLWGDSRGGMMAFLAARRLSRFAAIAVTGGPSDLIHLAQSRPDMKKVFQTWIPEFDKDPDRVLRDRSALYWVDELPTSLPILLLHGARDQRVDVDSTFKLASRLSELGHPYRLVVFENGSHTLAEHEREVSAQIQAWFLEKLSGGQGGEAALVN